jgi:hypothetical protein
MRKAPSYRHRRTGLSRIMRHRQNLETAIWVLPQARVLLRTNGGGDPQPEFSCRSKSVRYWERLASRGSGSFVRRSDNRQARSMAPV